jgi:signal transduction histidine kinase
LFVFVLVIGGAAYYEFVVEQRGKPEKRRFAESVMDELDEIGLRFGLPAALLGLLGGWFLMSKAMAPVTALTNAASRITEHNLRDALPRTGNGDELDRLTEVFNAMTARLDGSFQRIREFTLHASHELKTPLTVLQGEMEAALQDPNLSPAQRERCHTQLVEIQRLAQIVEGLALLTKADAGHVVLAREPVRLDELVRDAFADAQILAQPGSIRVTLEGCEPLTLTGDRNRLRQLLLNLTDNAVKYSEAGGRVTLALRRVGGQAELTVTNTGPGIAPEVLPRAFDRFFRGDPSHSNDVDGCGLGLSICQWIVTAHKGTIQLTSEPGGLTRVRVVLPQTTP